MDRVPVVLVSSKRASAAPKKRKGYLPIGPFSRWVEAEYQKVLVNETLVGPPLEELAIRLGLDPHNGQRYVYRWRNRLNASDQPTRLIRFLTVAEVLHVAGVEFSELYPAWCASCGRKKAYGGSTGLCWGCYAAAGSHTGRKTRKGPVLADEEIWTLAQQLYERRGLAIRPIAKLLYPRTRYASEASFASVMFEQARRRGWKVRDHRELMAERNRRKHDHLPQCTFVRKRGGRCRRRTGHESGRCWHHRAENMEPRLRRLHAVG